MTRSRRAVLRSGAGALSLGVLAGCLSEPGGEDGNPEEGYAAFFTLADWTEHIVGDELTIENPVETGEMGHGWEPPVDLQREITESAFFVYLDSPEFAWAQDVAADLESEDVALINGLEAVESQLLPMDRETDEDREPVAEYDDDPAAVEIAEFELYDGRTGEEVAYWHDDHWHGGVPDVPLDGQITIEGVFEDAKGRVLPLGDDEPFTLEATVVDGADEDALEIEPQGDHVEFHGLEESRTMVVFELVVDGEVVWDTSADNLSVAVVEDDGEDGTEFADPHVWVDPVLAQEMVETIAAELGELDPDNADTYEENAADYTDRMDEVHRQLEDVAENATRDVAVLAGHQSFGYLEERYDFEIRTPVGVSPDAVESSEDVSELIEVIEEENIETILYDPFETPDPEEDVPQMVEVLLEETDATDAEPVTPAEGTTEEWSEQGYGWVELMEEITIPSLANALGAE
ncbi:metal ABC transporter solute-binding protein, Zn/Mn family [Natronococcus occultus]|uniref:ABC-type metal ion transport system, periplasmic component/surface adhesin n=1 Tax=Natronococcus occultus SP4 TaxID=694430 RepID=L0JXB9_9EURY|nr:zinc ABC transporter substrate-binding protein [Natronococcus occultus]AGB37401.1 ABC-type metal ion transport system, periplasmic component/surface adhesin [Natronococcus occultus SP4]